jgi:NitT/TauT family transport system permease protein
LRAPRVFGQKQVAVVKQFFLHGILREDAFGSAQRPRGAAWIDILVFLGLAGVLFGLIDLGSSWSKPVRHVAIDLSLGALPRYTLLSLARILVAYLLSLIFALTFSYWAVKDPVAGRVILPLVDVFRRGVPALGLMPLLILALFHVFPDSNLGLELGAILVIFMAQAWPLAASFRHALRLVPHDQQEMATAFRFSAWQRFQWVELPSSMTSLVWNSMVCMARGWFVLVVSEAFVLGQQDYRLPGIGSYMSGAVDRRDWEAVLAAVVAMTLLIGALDQLLWRPLVVWAQKFRLEEEAASEPMSSWFLAWLRHSRLRILVRRFLHRWRPRRKTAPAPVPRARPARVQAARPWARVAHWLVALLALPLAYGAWQLAGILLEVSPGQWAGLVGAALLTLGRVILATSLGVVWALPVGLAIGLSPRWSGVLQPVVQVLASFPVPLLFPAVVAGLHAAGVPLGWGSILLMFLATQSYILFNVIAGATAIPTELKEAVRSYRLSLGQRFWSLYVPAVLPSLLTGWDAAAGASWNASLVTEYVTSWHDVLQTWGLGAAIAGAARRGNFSMLAAGVVVLCLLLWVLDKTVWRLARSMAEQRFSLA